MTKNDILSIPLEDLATSISEDRGTVGSFCKTYDLAAKSSWFMPQLMAEINTWKLVKAGDLYDGYETLKLNTKDNVRNRGIYHLCIEKTRGLLLSEGPQYASPNSRYCKLVPLIMSAFKQYRNIPYSSWTNIRSITESELYLAMTTEVPDFTKDELIRYRTTGLLYKSGIRVGTSRKASSSYGLYGLGSEGGKFPDLPLLTKIMLTQIWAAHPSNRSNFMVLNPLDWDDMPEPLISAEILTDKTPRIKKEVVREIPPWEM